MSHLQTVMWNSWPFVCCRSIMGEMSNSKLSHLIPSYKLLRGDSELYCMQATRLGNIKWFSLKQAILLAVHKRFREWCGRWAPWNPSGFYLHHCTSDCKHGPAFSRYFTTALFFSPDFSALQKGFTVSEEVCPPTLSPVFLSVSLPTTLVSV